MLKFRQKVYLMRVVSRLPTFIGIFFFTPQQTSLGLLCLKRFQKHWFWPFRQTVQLTCCLPKLHLLKCFFSPLCRKRNYELECRICNLYVFLYYSSYFSLCLSYIIYLGFFQNSKYVVFCIFFFVKYHSRNNSFRT